MAKVKAENLDTAIRTILSEYGDDIAKNIDEATERAAKAGVDALRNESKAKFKTKGKYRYAKGWTKQIEKKRFATEAVIYNKTPGLPHLLEHGHAKRGGGRTPGREHIAPVEEKLCKEYEKAVEGVLL